MGLPVADKGDSQEICFVPNGDYAAFIDAYFREQGIERERTRGEIVTADGRTLGEHEGVHRYTVGQRRGLNIAVGEPLYVIATDPATQRVIVGRNDGIAQDEHDGRERQLDRFPAPGSARARRDQDPQQARRRAGHDLPGPRIRRASKPALTSRSAP